MKNTVVRQVTSCSPVDVTENGEKHAASLFLKTETKVFSEQWVNLYNTVGVKTQRTLVTHFITKYRTKDE